MKITAVFDTLEAAEAAAAQVEASMPTAHRRTGLLRDSADYNPAESVPTEVFYARTNGLVNAGFAAAVYPGVLSGGINPPGIYQGTVPYPYLDLAPAFESREEPSEEALLTLEVGSNHVHQAESILISHHGHSIQIRESHQ